MGGFSIDNLYYICHIKIMRTHSNSFKLFAAALAITCSAVAYVSAKEPPQMITPDCTEQDGKRVCTVTHSDGTKFTTGEQPAPLPPPKPRPQSQPHHNSVNGSGGGVEYGVGGNGPPPPPVVVQAPPAVNIPPQVIQLGPVIIQVPQVIIPQPQFIQPPIVAQPIPIPLPPAANCVVVVGAGAMLNLRVAPGGQTFALLPPGTPLVMAGGGPDWILVNTPYGQGWVWGRYIQCY